ncbi:MAG: ATP-binding protein [Caulobacteraceae bacterium]
MIDSLLIANRGEIARRIIRTARRLGVRTIAVFSQADAGAAHVREADEAVAIGPSSVRESYLAADTILAAARRTGAAAIHPGYGFLAENAEFAEAVIAAGLAWVGPPAAAIRAMGLKDSAKRLMIEAGVAVTPGYLGEDQSERRLAAEAAAIGWPVLIKAVAGGGGKGMRKVEGPGEFKGALAGARREAAAAFGEDRVLIEKFVARPRHVEVQVFGDAEGGLVHLFERDCSLQRRHQKVIEEAPAPGMDGAAREALCAAAVRAARAVNYQGAGTVEFIADASEGLSADRMWFMEMNTRLQVEHPVTEAITGLDLVEWQLRIASGEPLPLAQDQIAMSGHAIEARLYAEDPARGFLPSTGVLARFRLPRGGRIDSGYEEGDEVTAFYDPMIAKLVSHAGSRDGAAGELARLCRGIEAWPVKTNAAFLARCLDDPAFIAGRLDTGFIEARLPALGEKRAPPLADAVLALAEGGEGEGPAAGPWSGRGPAWGLRLNAAPPRAWRIFVDGEPRLAEVPSDAARGDASPAKVARVGGQTLLFHAGAVFVLALEPDIAEIAAAGSADGVVRAPMPGRIVQVSVKVGEAVTAGQAILVLEAMKMEHALLAPAKGEIAEILCREGDQVGEGAALARVVAKG